MSPKNTIAAYLIPVNLFAVIWYLITLVLLVLGILVIYFQHYLPKRLVNAYKYGKLLNATDDRSLRYTGETVVECIKDLFRGQVRQVPKRFVLSLNL